LNLYRRRPCSFSGVIPKIDIWRAQLMAQSGRGNEETVVRADELAAAGDPGAAVWRRITDAVAQLANNTPH